MLVKNVYLPLKPFWGLGDFLRGALSLVNLCREYEFDFEIDYSLHPIGKYLENRHSTPVEFTNDEVTEYDMHSCHHIKDVFNQISQLPKEDTKDITLLLTSNLWYMEKGVAESIRTFIRESMVPTEDLQRAIIKTQKVIGVESGKYAVLHIRTGDKYLVDGKSSEEGFESLLKQIEKGFEEFGFPECPIVILSDSYAFKQYLNAKKGWRMSPVEPCHLSIKVDDEKVKQTLVDMFILSEATSVFCISNHGYGSGFCDWTCDIFNVPCTRFSNPDVKKEWNVHLYSDKKTIIPAE